MSNFFSWNNVGLNGVCVLFILVIFVDYLNFTYLPNLSEDKLLKKIMYHCALRDDRVKQKYRNHGYYSAFPKDFNGVTCAVTMWEISHLLTHVFIGYFYNIYISMGISVGFEIYEKYWHSAESYTDVVWNFIGMVIGASLRSLL